MGLAPDDALVHTSICGSQALSGCQEQLQHWQTEVQCIWYTCYTCQADEHTAQLTLCRDASLIGFQWISLTRMRYSKLEISQRCHRCCMRATRFELAFPV